MQADSFWCECLKHGLKHASLGVAYVRNATSRLRWCHCICTAACIRQVELGHTCTHIHSSVGVVVGDKLDVDYVRNATSSLLSHTRALSLPLSLDPDGWA